MRFLTKEEIKVLSGRVRRLKQIEALTSMGIDFRLNAIGDIVICDTDVPISGKLSEQHIKTEVNVNAIKRRN